MRSDREKVQDILEAVSKIEKYAMKGRKAFDLVGGTSLISFKSVLDRDLCVPVCSAECLNTGKHSKP